MENQEIIELLFPLYVKNIKNFYLKIECEESRKHFNLIHDIKLRNSKKHNHWCRDFRSEIIISTKNILKLQNLEIEEINETLKETINAVTIYPDLI